MAKATTKTKKAKKQAAPKERKPYHIHEEIDQTLKEYNEKSRGRITEHERYVHTQKLKALREELSLYYADGARPCPRCGHPPHGSQIDLSTVQVACMMCAPYPETIELKGEKVPVMRSVAGRGKTREEAVKHWNAGPSKWMATLTDGTRIND